MVNSATFQVAEGSRIGSAGVMEPHPQVRGLFQPAGASQARRAPAEERPCGAEASLCRQSRGLPALLLLPSATSAAGSSPSARQRPLEVGHGAANPVSSAATSTPCGGLGHPVFRNTFLVNALGMSIAGHSPDISVWLWADSNIRTSKSKVQRLA